MSANDYSLQSVVAFLEASLSSCFGVSKGDEAPEGRLALRRRYRELKKLAKRISRDSRDTVLAPPWFLQNTIPGAVEAAPPPIGLYGLSIFAATAESRSLHSWSGRDLRYASGHISPLVADTQATPIDSALRIAFGGLSAFFYAVADSWSRSLSVEAPASIASRPLRRPADDRLYLALMRFVFGFFGSHKVDARNNP